MHSLFDVCSCSRLCANVSVLAGTYVRRSRRLSSGAIRRAVTPDADSDSAADAWRVLALDFDNGCAAYSACAQPLYAVVAMNAQWAAANLTLEGSASFALTQPVAMYRTSAAEDYAEVQVPALGADGSLLVDAPEMSIVTLFFK